MSDAATSLLLRAQRLESLSAWRSPEANVATLHLPLEEDGTHLAALERLERLAAADPACRGGLRDVERAAAFVRAAAAAAGRKGLTVVSCAKYGVFEAFGSSESPLPGLSVSKRAELAPLAAASRRHPRFLVLLAGEGRARFLESHLGERAELEESGDGPDGLAARAERWRRERRTDLFVLGASAGLQERLRPALSPELRAALIPEPSLGADAAADALADRLAQDERAARRVRESLLVDRFLADLRSGSAVAGLEAAAAVLQGGRARLVLVREGYARMGRCCPSCGRLSVDHRSCPYCFAASTTVLDLVAELLDRAQAAGIDVFRIGPDPRFDAAGRIGVVLGSPLPVRAARSAPPRTMRDARPGQAAPRPR